MSRKEIEYTLKKSRWYLCARGCWEPIKYAKWPSSKTGWRDKEISLGRYGMHLGYDHWRYIPFRSLTPQIWTVLTGLKFHRMPRRHNEPK